MPPCQKIGSKQENRSRFEFYSCHDPRCTFRAFSKTAESTQPNSFVPRIATSKFQRSHKTIDTDAGAIMLPAEMCDTNASQMLSSSMLKKDRLALTPQHFLSLPLKLPPPCVAVVVVVVVVVAVEAKAETTTRVKKATRDSSVFPPRRKFFSASAGTRRKRDFSFPLFHCFPILPFLSL